MGMSFLLLKPKNSSFVLESESGADGASGWGGAGAGWQSGDAGTIVIYVLGIVVCLMYEIQVHFFFCFSFFCNSNFLSIVCAIRNVFICYIFLNRVVESFADPRELPKCCSFIDDDLISFYGFLLVESAASNEP